MKDYNAALSKFVDRYKDKPNIVGILATGSFFHSKPDKNSDIDVHIITKKSNWRERGNTWIDGIEVEYFMNPIAQIKQYFKDDEKRGRPTTAHMFVNSKIMFKKGSDLTKLIALAQRFLNKKSPRMTSVQIQFAQYFVDDLQKDLEDVYLKKDIFAFKQIAQELQNKCLEYFFQIKQVQPDKSKRLLQFLNSTDKKFAALYKSALVESKIDVQYKSLNKLVKYVERLLGGKRPKEWKLRSKVQIS